MRIRRPIRGVVGYGLVVLQLGLLVALTLAADLRINSVKLQNGNQFTISYDGQAGAIYTLLQGNSVTNINTPVTTNQSVTTGPGQFVQSAAATESFFRIQQTSSGPVPPTSISETSPANGEGGVSVTRETVFRFSQPLAADTMLAQDMLYAQFGGRKLLARAELSSDHKTVTLFYLENLPGSARVRVTFDGNELKDSLGRIVDLDGDGNPGGVATIDFDTFSTTALLGTAVIGNVFASEQVQGTNSTNFVNRPLSGVTITVDGMEETLRAVTDTNGFFRLEPSPVGDFFVHIDGRTVTDPAAGIHYPDLAYYPFVGKAWNAAAGRTNNLAGGTGLIYLPLITRGTLQPVSLTNDTVITFPPDVIAKNTNLAGVSITVPPNTLFSPNGTRGGMVGIAPVPPDRLPGPLPPGLNFPLVITVQTDGAENFDRPVPVRFPNLPDPVTGQALPPGEKSALWSFNHDTGQWEIQGSMTVTADGLLIESDPGVGIRQPGWHASWPGVYWDFFFADPDDPCKSAISCAISRTRRERPNHRPTEDGCSIPPTLISQYYKELFRSECNEHDRDYGTFSPTPGHKARADQRLLQRMTVLARSLPPEDQGGAINAALRIFWGVQTFGGPFYLQAQGEASDCGCARSSNVSLLSAQEPQFVRRYGSTQTTAFFSITNYETDELVLRGKFGPALNLGSIVLAPDGWFTLSIFDPVSWSTGTRDFLTESSGTSFSLPTLDLAAPSLNDRDSDRLPDEVEAILGTSITNPDSDDDGISDGLEIHQGTDPLDGRPVITGIIATAPTSGAAVDICALNDMAVVAEGDAGVSVFNVSAGQNPVRMARVDTPGSAQRVSCSGNLIAVADGLAGLAILDISDPPNARIVQQVSLAGAAQAVAVAGDIAYVGLSVGGVVAVDMASGTILEQFSTDGAIHDLAIDGDSLFVLLNSELRAYSLADGTLEFLGGSTPPSNFPESISGLRRLFVGGGYAYVTSYPGYDVFDVRDPAHLAYVIFASAGGPISFKQIVLNGSGFGVAAVGTNPRADGTHDIYLYDVSNPTNTPRFLTVLPTPGTARAVSLYNALAYVADGEAGLQVMNYLPYDSKGVPPTITLSPSFILSTPTNAVAEEGKHVRVAAQVTDDVQVRNVEFYLDGVKVLTDGSFPFENGFVTPAISATKTNFNIRAKATDTGGNFSWSDEITVNLTPDATPPNVRRVFPGNSNATNGVQAYVVDSVQSFSFSVYFNEPIKAAVLTSTDVKITYAGRDNRLGTLDDVAITNLILNYQDSLNVLTVSHPQLLATGFYHVSLGTSVRDLAENAILQRIEWNFWILPGGSAGDADNDDLSNGDEVRLGTNPIVADSDGDGWDDGIEVQDGTDPLNSNSKPQAMWSARPRLEITLPTAAQLLDETSGVTIARPPVSVNIPKQ